MTGNGWLRLIEQNPGHSAWYIERFKQMAAEGADLDGEARLIDAMVPRRARILDAGCGPGRVGGRLAELGHDVIGVDIDPALIAAATFEHPNATWITADLADLEPGMIGDKRCDAIVCAGNVMTFLDPTTRRTVLQRLAGLLDDDGRLVIGFGADRGYSFEEFRDDAHHAGLDEHGAFATWDLRPFTSRSTFLVAVFAPRRTAAPAEARTAREPT